MTFSEWLKNRSLKEDYKKFDLEKQAAVATELAKAGNKPNPAAIARQVVNNPKVVQAARTMPGVKPDELKIKSDIDATLKMQQRAANMPRAGQARMV